MAALLQFIPLTLLLMAWPAGQTCSQPGGAMAGPVIAAAGADRAPAGSGAEDSGHGAAAPGAAAPGEVMLRDVVLVLDNSGSMRRNDPQSLAPAAVEEFIRGLDSGSRIAVLIFDQDVTLVQDFVRADSGRAALLDSLGAIDYQGQYTDSPAAIERAIYKLKNESRADAQRIVIFMTDGIVDTGNPQNDASRSEWLRTDLAADAARADIRIFAIAFTHDADFQLIQSLANKTEGDYFRALTAADLAGVFKRIHDTLARQPAPDPGPEATGGQASQPQVPEPIIIEVPARQQAGGEEERTRTLILIVAASVLCLTLLAILVVLLRRSRADRAPEDEYEPRAFLSDIHGVTDKASHELGMRPTMIGRVAGTDTDHLNYIVIPETTVGRRHALIEYKDYAYWIIDQGSINGTYVNDRMVATETRLKHGDRIRLHKFEFEFVMPEMFDSGMTVVSPTVYGGNAYGDGNPAAAAAGPAAGAADEANLFDIGDNDDSTPSSGRITLSEEDYRDNDSEDVTIQYGDVGPAGAPPRPSAGDDADADVTLMPAMDSGASDEDKTLHRVTAGASDDGNDTDEWQVDDGGKPRRED